MKTSTTVTAGWLVLSAALSGCGSAPVEADSDSDFEIAAAVSKLVNMQDIVYDGWDIPATQCTVDGTTMHCCQPGRAMVGARLDLNVFACAAFQFPESAGGVRTRDVGTQRNGMHSCPLGQVMVGFHETLDHLACQTIPGIVVTKEIVDSGTQDAFPMHVCPPTSSYAMSGIRVDQNKFNCASDVSSMRATYFKEMGRSRPFGCSSLGFTFDFAPIASLAPTIELIDGFYYCHYSSVNVEVLNGSTHRLGAPSIGACHTSTAFGPSNQVILTPNLCGP